MPPTLEAEGREPSGPFVLNSNVYRAARAAPLQENNYFGFKVSGIGLAPFSLPTFLDTDTCISLGFPRTRTQPLAVLVLVKGTLWNTLISRNLGN